MLKINIRFADFTSRAALFELQVEQDTTVGALKTMADAHFLSSDGVCPMKYFDKWYLEVRVGDRKKLLGIDEGDEGLLLAAAGLEDESVVYLEGPMFNESQAEVGRAIASVRAQSKAQAAQHSLYVQGLKEEMVRRFDAMAAKQQEQSEELEERLSCMSLAQQTLEANQQKNFEQLSVTLKELREWTELQPLKQSSAEVGRLLQKHDNRPLRALWESLTGADTTGIQLPMAIITDRRCGIERRAELADGPMKSKSGFTINDTYDYGPTPLIIAVNAGRNDLVSALLSNSADYDATFGTSFMTATHVAAITNNAGAIELLVGYGADASKPTKGNVTPLHFAAFNGHAASIEALVALGADLTRVNSVGNTPLQMLSMKKVADGQHSSGHEADEQKKRIVDLLTPKS